ncbi:hypothetical protein TWF694_005666 [Orbilia ellipsospora]|uniref:Cell wall protein PhiA n=1 Tax=Orbilia ellipsospora TaxID=2528407 RepID=A0AAV9WXN8_9PEZI
MVFVKASALLSLLAVASAAPTGDIEARSSPQAYSFLALRSASPIHFQSWNANSGNIWLGKPTAKYCPVAPAQCPKGTGTSFYVDNQYWTASMNTVVPGGQQLYIDPHGALAYTQAHSASIPSGSLTTGFQVKQSGGLWYFSHCEGGFLACPLKKGTTGPWKIFIDGKRVLKDSDVPTKCKKDCLGFDAAGSRGDAGPLAVWQFI